MTAETLLHSPALNALLQVATNPKRWPSRSQIASEAGIAASHLANAAYGRRSLSVEASRSVSEVLGIEPDAFWVPAAAQPADWRVDEELKQMVAMQKSFEENFTRLWSAVTERAKGD